MLKIERTTRFKKDYKKVLKQGIPKEEIEKVVSNLANGIELDSKYKDHKLLGKFADYRECHIRPDCLLIYKINREVLILTLIRLGSHAELFQL